jgi:acetoin utilization deacetylase AcuC-like enzyme
MAWWHRWRARARINTAVGLWYHRDYAALDIPPERRVAHVQTDRAEQALARLMHLGLVSEADVATPPLAQLEDLERVHPPSYLEQVSQPEVLGRIFGISAAEVDVDPLIAAQRRAVGGTIAASLAVIRGAVRVGFNLGGGFHHAAPDRGAGFCIFNDVAVAIARLRARGFSAPIAIVDLDFHQGDGNLLAFAEDPSVLVYSIHGSSWTDCESPACRNYTLPPAASDREYLALLDETLPGALSRHGTKLVYYLAGVDVLDGDRLGDFRLTPKGVLARDRRVIAAASILGAPVVVTLAGGYGAGAWQCTVNFVRWLLTGAKRVDRSPAEKLAYHYAEVARRIAPWELQHEDGDFSIDADDLLPGRERRPRRLVLDFYSTQGIELVFERYGLLEKLRQRGFADLHVLVDGADPQAQRICIEGTPVSEPGPVYLLLELVLSRGSLPAPAELEGKPLSLLKIEWLLLQNPTQSFSPSRPRPPGQQFPGLGLASEVHQLLVEVSKHLRFDGNWHRPAHYHNAVVAGRNYRFLDPVAEGKLRALRRVLANVTLAEASNLVSQGRVVYGDGRPLVWVPHDLVLPASERLAAYFETSSHGEQAMAEAERLLASGLHLIADA